MALDTNTLRTRSLSAAVFVIILLSAWFYDVWTFAIVNGLIVAGLLYEWTKLSMKIRQVSAPALPIVMAVLGAIFYGFLVYFYLVISMDPYNPYADPGKTAMFQLLLYAGLIICSLLLVITILSRDFARLFLFSLLIIGFLYFTTAYGLVLALYHWHIPFIILFCIWINDTTAYLMGSLIGKTPMAPNISPKKTWEGTLSGILLTVLIAWISSQVYKGSDIAFFSSSQIVIIALISASMGTLGDLIESSIKRMAGVKDSGNIMPGHGGVFDRFDAYSYAIVWVCAYLYFFY